MPSAICAGVAFFFCANRLEQIDDRPVRRQVLRREAIESGAKIRFRVELRASVHLPGQVAHANRTPWDEADAQLLTGSKHAVLFRVSFHERVFGLDGCHRLHGVRPADRFAARLGETEVQDFALP